MAKERVIEITGDIGGYSFSMGYINYMMKELGDGAITAKVTSYGGDVNHALKIKNLFADHGDVTVEYVGLNASAATIIGHGAKKTLIHEDSLYLIHKPMVWVDTWGRMNEDELEQAITDLQAQKKDAETFTLVIAKDYVNSRGMELSKVMELMKESRWLSAKEAVELGLVDEVIPSKNKKPVITNQAVAIMSGMGLPVPEITSEESPSGFQVVVNRLSRMEENIKNFIHSKNSVTMDKQYSFLNQVLNVDGLPVTDNKVTLTAEQIAALNTALETKDQAKATAESTLSKLTNSLDELDPAVKAAADPDAKAQAIRTIMAKRPGVQPATPAGASGDNGDPTDKVQWEDIDGLAHNKEADKNLI